MVPPADFDDDADADDDVDDNDGGDGDNDDDAGDNDEADDVVPQGLIRRASYCRHAFSGTCDTGGLDYNKNNKKTATIQQSCAF